MSNTLPEVHRTPATALLTVPRASPISRAAQWQSDAVDDFGSTSRGEPLTCTKSKKELIACNCLLPRRNRLPLPARVLGEWFVGGCMTAVGHATTLLVHACRASTTRLLGSPVHGWVSHIVGSKGPPRREPVTPVQCPPNVTGAL